MSRKALGRGLGDLLHGARPARPVTRAANPEPTGPQAQPTPSEPLLLPPTPAEIAPASPSAQAAPTPLPPQDPALTPTPAPSPLGSPPAKPTRPGLDPRLPRFGPAYTPPPEPEAPPGRGGLYLVLILDTLLLAFAALMGFGPWVARPLSLYLAGAAVLAGGALACGAIAYQATPHRPDAGSPKPSRVRVRLTRL